MFLESDVCMRQCCGPGRGFTMHITDNLGQVCSLLSGMVFDIVASPFMHDKNIGQVCIPNTKIKKINK